MEAEFRRTAERRYAITIHHDDRPPIDMDPAPGFDPIMPHDLLHLIVESELGLRRGIFGQVASGGHAGTFHRAGPVGGDRRQAARDRRRAARRGDALLRQGRGEAAQSERATYLCLYAWLARSADPARRRVAARLAPQARHFREIQPAAERRALSGEALARICARLDDLSARWASLEIGGSVTVEWPDANGRPSARS